MSTPTLRRTRGLAAALLVLAIPLAARAAHGPTWTAVLRAHAAMDLSAARAAALDCVRSGDPADAVAAAGWWQENIEVLTEPDEILAAAHGRTQPELAWILHQIDGTLNRHAPAGVLTPWELSGAWGVLSTLDLDRPVVPPDARLPAMGAPWIAAWEPWRLELRSADGTVSPPGPMALDGVYLAAWSFVSPEAEGAWLVVEAQCGYNLFLDGQRLARERRCGRLSAGVHWYALSLGPGPHRLRAEIADPNLPRLRVSLLDASGAPLAVRLRPGWIPDRTAPSRAQPSASPAELALGSGRPASLDGALLRAQLARGRHDASAERHWLGQAAAMSPGDPLVHVMLARFFLTEPTGAAPEVDYRRARKELDGSGDLPMTLLVRRILDQKQQRQDDAEKALEELVRLHPDDPRVLRLWVQEAVSRGWPREAEDALGRLEALLPGSPWVVNLRIRVLKALSRLEERQGILKALATTDPLSPGLAEILLASCLTGPARHVLERRRQVEDSPSLDLALVRLTLGEGDITGAGKLLEAARRRWGGIGPVDDLAITIAAAQGTDPETAAVTSALGRTPSTLQLRTLLWHLGGRPFWSPYRVDALEIAKKHGEAPTGMDSELILDQAVERVYEDGSSLYYYHGLTRALTPAGVDQAATVQLLPDTELLSVRVIKADGSVVVPPEATSNGRGFVIKDVDPGDMVESEYVSAVAPTGASRRGHLSPYIYRFADTDRGFGLSEYTLLVPPDIDLVVDGHFEGLATTDETAGKLHLLRWRAEDMPPMVQEPFGPPSQELMPWVNYGFGVSWQDVGDSIRDRILAAMEGSPELDAWGLPLLKDGSPEEALRRLAAAMDRDLEAGRGVLTLGETAGQSFSLKRGNQATILATLLVEAGWTVDLVLARPAPYAGTHLKVPNFDAFTTPLLRVARGGEVLWVDPALGPAGVAHIRPILQHSDGLVLPLSAPDHEVHYLKKTPSFPNPELEERVALKARILASGDAEVAYDMTLHGRQAKRLEDMIGGVPKDRLPVVYQQIAANIFSGADNVSGAVERQDDRDVVLHLDLHLPSACLPDGETMVCQALVLAHPISARLASLPTRQTPLVLQLPVLQRLETELILPKGWTLDQASRRVESTYGSVVRTVAATGNTAHSTLELHLPAQTVPPETYPEWVRFCHAADELLTQPPRLRPEKGTAKR
ncbi:MAG: DUF3857 domain-containing protein [Acidobacteria bacterium]|nr:DUF3857 domain-containing protein [Acidobacteriota bacterium]